MKPVRYLSGLLTAIGIATAGCSASVNVVERPKPKPKPQLISPDVINIPETPWMASNDKECAPGKKHIKRLNGRYGLEIAKLIEPKSANAFDFCKKFYVGIFAEIINNNDKKKVLYTLHPDSKELYSVVSIKTAPKTYSTINCNVTDTVSCEKFMNVYVGDVHKTVNDPFGYGILNRRKMGLGLLLYDWTSKKPCDVEVDKIPKEHRKMVTEKCDRQDEEESKAVELAERGLTLLRIIEQEKGLYYLP